MGWLEYHDTAKTQLKRVVFAPFHPSYYRRFGGRQKPGSGEDIFDRTERKLSGALRERAMDIFSIIAFGHTRKPCYFSTRHYFVYQPEDIIIERSTLSKFEEQGHREIIEASFHRYGYRVQESLTKWLNDDVHADIAKDDLLRFTKGLQRSYKEEQAVS
jgi:hypothetical protein